MSFERFELQKGNDMYPLRDRLRKKDLSLEDIVVLLNEQNDEVQDLHDKIYKVLNREYRDTRWKNAGANVRMELLLNIAKELDVEL